MDSYPNLATRVLLATMAQDRPTVRSVAQEVGCSVERSHSALTQLREDGLVDWVDGAKGTLHATCAQVERWTTRC